ncbi:DUF1127 domain-containing protein [Vibrio mediterranei]|jgi:uncharacterized protein YjiS (DUF1127 family)|uniref:DUF1127 domain-containing protein n=1 Tax=Vibrio mediterranei TaxID=689 RepID=A0A3G4VG10_9VIBR|nr:MULTISPECIES: DUF1127 domain-containing protein [Vibrio]AYV21931.1 DUF1127 domain-containing protein [Vibrio mediterranei]MCG9785875.1 DUF1127 domain-containing protein [Vibrio mediterranei]MCY9851562.1 DUF1127 domain-containing protein [Vibrio mediterranei]MDA0109625.1 DUF1127 domain-containing protein [Vibrio sp. La 4.2.2]NUW71318.1 DUF1127 domain-containing protein [Vibrio mediterranei]
MRTSIYLTVATWLIKADIQKEEREWRRRYRRNAHHLPLHNEHLLKDIGLDRHGRPLGQVAPPHIVAKRKTRHLRRELHSRIAT